MNKIVSDTIWKNILTLLIGDFKSHVWSKTHIRPFESSENIQKTNNSHKSHKILINILFV